MTTILEARAEKWMQNEREEFAAKEKRAAWHPTNPSVGVLNSKGKPKYYITENGNIVNTDINGKRI